MFRSRRTVPESPELVPLQQPVAWEPDPTWMTAPPPRRRSIRTPSPVHDYMFGVPYNPYDPNHVPLPRLLQSYSNNHTGSPMTDKSRVVKSSRSLGNIHRRTPDRYLHTHPQAAEPIPVVPMTYASQSHMRVRPEIDEERERRLREERERLLDEEQARLAKEMRISLKEELRRQEALDKAARKEARASERSGKLKRHQAALDHGPTGHRIVSQTQFYQPYSPIQPQVYQPPLEFQSQAQPAPYNPPRPVVTSQYSAYPPNGTTPPPGVLGLRKTQSVYQYRSAPSKPSPYHPPPPFGQPF